MLHAFFRMFAFVPFLLVLNCAPAAALDHGNLIGIHVMTVHPKPGVTVQDFQDFYVGKVLPGYERQWPGLRAFLLRPFSPKAGNQFAIVWLFQSVAHRNRYFSPDGKANARELAAREGVKPIEAELKAKFGDYTVRYTDDDDWVIQ